MDLIQFISAAGIGGIVGSLLTTIIQAWLSNTQAIQNRKFQEKKEAYIGFFEAAHVNEMEQTNQSSLNWAYWQARCELVGSGDVLKCIKSVEDTNPVDGNIHPDRKQALSELKMAMRNDLGIDLSVF